MKKSIAELSDDEIRDWLDLSERDLGKWLDVLDKLMDEIVKRKATSLMLHPILNMRSFLRRLELRTR